MSGGLLPGSLSRQRQGRALCFLIGVTTGTLEAAAAAAMAAYLDPLPTLPVNPPREVWCSGLGSALQMSLGMPQPVQFLLSSRRQMEPSDFVATAEIQRNHHAPYSFSLPSVYSVLS